MIYVIKPYECWIELRGNPWVRNADGRRLRALDAITSKRMEEFGIKTATSFQLPSGKQSIGQPWFEEDADGNIRQVYETVDTQSLTVREIENRIAALEKATQEQNCVAIAGLGYPVVIGPDWMSIKCRKHTKEEWRAFTDREILAMDEGRKALDFWNKHKDFLLSS